MGGSRQEKVGVVVIHGVGETYEGWIDSYLVPEMERWAAYKSVDGLDRWAAYEKANRRKPKGCELVVNARCSDGRHICVGLANDQDFATFAALAAPNEPIIQEFVTAAGRETHLDQLKSFVRSKIASRTSHDWLALLQAETANVPSAPAFTPMSEVYRVRDPESSEPTSTWQSFTRRCALDNQEVTVSELYWADMSKIGDTSVSRSSAVAQLFLEAPFVLGGAFLNGCNTGIYRAIAWLVKASNWLMRWPIAGFAVPIFVVAGVAILLKELSLFAWLPAAVAVTLTVVMFGGAKAFRSFVHRKVGLADVGLAACVFSFLLLLGLGIAVSTMPPQALVSPVPYVRIGVGLLLLSWTLWTLTIVLAALFVCCAAFWQLISGKRKPPLSRPAAAISLNLLLGMIWKLILPILGVLIINVLVPASQTRGANCPAAGLPSPWSNVSPECTLWFTKATLTQVALLNLGAVLAVSCAALLVVGARTLMGRLFEQRARTRGLPRLIASPVIVATLFASAFVNASIFILDFDNEFWGRLQSWLPGGLASVGVSVIGLFALYYIFQRVIERTTSVVHIGRDLVDHQYGREPRTLSTWLVPEEAEDPGEHAGHQHGRVMPMDLLGRYLSRSGGEGFKNFRRRRRIQRRLEALIDEVIADLAVKRLIFLAHSQGSVILHDYLVNHDNLVRKSHQDAQSLDDVKRIDVVTVGSPLTHIYRHYFADYDSSAMEDGDRSPLIKRVKTWTNLWRIDDPIGQRVEVHPAIENIALGRGGHMYYWRENEVCQRLWTLILDPPDSSQPMVQRGGAVSTGKQEAEADVPQLPEVTAGSHA